MKLYDYKQWTKISYYHKVDKKKVKGIVWLRTSVFKNLPQGIDKYLEEQYPDIKILNFVVQEFDSGIHSKTRIH